MYSPDVMIENYIGGISLQKLIHRLTIDLLCMRTSYFIFFKVSLTLLHSFKLLIWITNNVMIRIDAELWFLMVLAIFNQIYENDCSSRPFCFLFSTEITFRYITIVNEKYNKKWKNIQKHITLNIHMASKCSIIFVFNLPMSYW